MRRRASTITGATVWMIGFLAVSDAHEPEPIPPSSDPGAFRHYLMENVGGNAKELKQKLERGDVEGMAVNAEAIALHGTRVPDLFPKGSGSESSRAKAEIWTDWDGFVAAAGEMTNRASELAMASAAGDADAAGAGLKKLFGSCKSCHDSYREPEKD